MTKVDEVGVSGLSSRTAISYDATNGMYALSDTDSGDSAGLGQGDIVQSTSEFTRYQTSAAHTEDELYVYKLSQNSTVKLSYVDWAFWVHSDDTTGRTSERNLIFGFPTADANMPHTGTADYSTLLNGNYTSVNHDGALTRFGLTGSSTFSVNFATNQVSTELLLNSALDGTPIGTYDGTSSIFEAQFGGELTSANPAFKWGAFTGGFFGPQAEEMGYAYYIYEEVGGRASAAPGNEEHYIYGTVLGAK